MSSLGSLTLVELEDSAGVLTATPLSSTQRAAIRDVINVEYHSALNAYDWPQLYREVTGALRKADEAGLAIFDGGDRQVPILPEAGEMVSMHPANREFEIEILTPTQFHDRVGGINIARAGMPQIIAYAGSTAQYRRIAAAGACVVKSSSSANNNALVPKVLYRPDGRTANSEMWEDVNGDFATGVALSEDVSAGYAIQAVSIPAGWSGDLTIELASDGTEYVNIPQVTKLSSAGSRSSRVYAGSLLSCWPVPETDSAATMVYRWRPPRLTEPNDAPVIPISDYLLHKACSALRMRENNMEAARAHDAKAFESLSRSWRDVPSAPRQIRPRRSLDAMFGMDGYRWRR